MSAGRSTRPSGGAVALQPAFVLHRRDYRETSLLIEALGASTGRVGLVARGARRARSPLRAVLQPFTPLLLSWSGRGDLGTLTGAEADGPTGEMPGGALLVGLYLNELLVRLMHRHDPHPGLFETYRATLDLLRGGVEPEPVLRIFEKRLLEAIGYALVLDRDAETGAALRPGSSYLYVLDRGPVEAHGADHDAVRVTGGTLLALARERLTDDRMLGEAKALMRAAIGAHLGGRPLASRALMRPPRPAREGS